MKLKQVQTRQKEGAAAAFRTVRRERQSSAAAFNPIALLTRSTEEDHPQAKLKIGSPGDIYEQEADQVEDRVMNMPEPVAQRQVEEEQEEPIQAKPLAEQITPLVQRQAEEEEEPLQEKSLLQRQLEEEEEEEPIQAKSLAEQITPLVQRQAEEEEEPVQEKTLLQLQVEDEEEPLRTKSKPGETPTANPRLESRINSLKGGGQPLPESTRGFFEAWFGREFGGVRIHSHSNAAQLARSFNAKAFTRGRNVVFGAGQYQPGTSSGKRLLAHELTHVLQQSKNISPKIQRKATWNPPVLNRRNAAKVFYYSKALMGTPAGLAELVVNGINIKDNLELMRAIPQPSIDSTTRTDGSVKCWFKNPANATAHSRLDIFTKPPWKFTLPTSEVAKKYSSADKCKGKTGKTVIRARDWYNKDAKLEKLVHKGEMEHNNAYKKEFRKYIGKYVSNIKKHHGPKKGLVVPGSKTTKPINCVAKLRKIENRQLLTDMVFAINKANRYIHRNDRHEVTLTGLIINKNCSRVLIQVIPPNL